MKKNFSVFVTLSILGYMALFANYLLFVKKVRVNIPGRAGFEVASILKRQKKSKYIQAPKQRD